VDLLFVFAHQFIEDRGRVWSPGQFPRSAWNRYLYNFNHLHVLGRKKPRRKDVDLSGYNRSDRDNVTFHLIESRRGSILDRIKRPWQTHSILEKIVPNVDAVIGRDSTMAWTAVKMAEKREIPWAVEVVGVTWDALWNHGSNAAKVYAPIAELRKKYWVKRAPFALYVTEETLQKRYPCNGYTAGISNVVIPEPEEAVLRRRLQKIRNGSSGPLTFGFLGSVESESKGLEYAFRALSHVGTDIPEYELRVLGPGNPDRWTQLAAQLGIRPRVTFDGVLPSGEPVLRWLDEIDVYLHPRLQDGLPRSLIEAMSRACPVLSSQAGGILELLPSSVTHEPGDWRKLAIHISSLAWSEEWKLKNARRNFEKSKEYSSYKLRAKRENFWGKFASYSRTKTKNK